MNKNTSSRRDWVEIGLKLFTPIMAGLLIAWAGYVSNATLSSVSSERESARLITELQIRREQAESDLRKDVFDQALQAFLLKNAQKIESIDAMSKQLLRLELLALNFGDSLSLSPLFSEFRQDLNKLKAPEKDSGVLTFDNDKADLMKRLLSLARRVASTQISSLAQHGVLKEIYIPLAYYKTMLASLDEDESRCRTLLYEGGYSWPERDIQRQLGLYDGYQDKLISKSNENEKDPIETHFTLGNNEVVSYESDYIASVNDERQISLDGVDRYLDINISDVNVCKETSQITIYLYQRKQETNESVKQSTPIEPILNSSDLANAKNYILNAADKRKYDAIKAAELLVDENSEKPNKSVNQVKLRKDELTVVVKRRFKLDYFNFPMVDNTRLSNNQRFAIVLDEFDMDSEPPMVRLIGIIFPSEYASLRDRPGMKEARQLLEEAMHDKITTADEDE